MRDITKYTLVLLILHLSFFTVTAQVSINEENSNPDPSAMLDISSTDKGLLVPRMSEDERDLIENPAQGLMIFNTTDSCFNYYTGINWYKDCGRNLMSDKTFFSPITFSNTALDNAKDVAIDNSGNIFVTGIFQSALQIGDTTLSSNGDSDLYLAKYDSEHHLLWAISIGSTDSDGDPNIAVDRQGNIYFSGRFQNSIAIGTTTLTTFASSDLFLAKYAPDATVLWAIQTEVDDSASPSGIGVDDNDDVYIVGDFFGTMTIGSSTLSTNTDDNGFLMKANDSGIWQWGVQFASSDELYPYSLAVNNNIVYVAGEMSGTATIGTSTYVNARGSGFVSKFDTDGNYIWSEALVAVDGNAGAYAITVDELDNFYVGGSASGTVTIGDTSIIFTNGSSKMYVTKYNASNSLQWFINQDNAFSRINDIDIDQAGDVVALGEYRGSLNFDTLSTSILGSLEEIFVLKMNADGAALWLEAGASNDNDSDDANSVAVDANNDLYIVGGYEGTITFSDVSLTSTGSDDALILKLNGETGRQFFFDNTLASSQDGDTDDGNELQSLSFDGSTLEISSSNSVNLSSLNTDNQIIDVLNLDGSTLEISLQDDGIETNTLDLSNLVPIGTIQMWPTDTPPSGWLICNGQNITQAAYPRLYLVLGGTNGNINIPNFEGRFPLGAGRSSQTTATSHTLLSTGGEETHTLTLEEMPAHSHEISYRTRNKDGNGTQVSDLSMTGSTANTESAGGDTNGNTVPHNNMPPFYTIHFIIKAE